MNGLNPKKRVFLNCHGRLLPLLLVGLATISIVSLPAFAQYQVAVIEGGTASSQDVADQLNDNTFFDFDATVVAPDELDSPEELAAYDVIVWGDSGNDDGAWTEAMAASIKTWAETEGGGIVSTSWIPYAMGDNPIDLAMDDLTPIDAAPDETDYWCKPPTDTDPLELSATVDHPILQGITSISVNTEFINFSPTVHDGTNTAVISEITNATSCNSTYSTYPAIVVGELGDGLTAYLGFMFNASTSNYDVGEIREGVSDRLLEQAVHWVAGNGDADDDDITNVNDNCPFVDNNEQANADSDEFGNSCDDDDDDDTIFDTDDNCPLVANQNQNDENENGVGDACDTEVPVDSETETGTELDTDTTVDTLDSEDSEATVDTADSEDTVDTADSLDPDSENNDSDSDSDSDSDNDEGGSSSDEGCGCSTTGHKTSNPWTLILAISLTAIILRRRSLKITK